MRKPLLDRHLHPRPWLKEIVAKLPARVQPGPIPYGLVMAVDEEGKILGSLHDPGGKRAREITSVQPAGDWLYLGTLERDGILKVQRPVFEP